MGQSSSAPAVDVNQLRQISDEQIESHIALSNLQFVQSRAIELAERRERITWEALAALTMTGILLVAGSIYKRKDFAIPIAPIIMSAGYRYDVAFGSNQETIRDSAEKLLQDSSKPFEFIGGPITLTQVDALRKSWKQM